MLSAVVYVGPQARALDRLDSHSLDRPVLAVADPTAATLADDRVGAVVVDPEASVDPALLADCEAPVLALADSDFPDAAVDRRVDAGDLGTAVAASLDGTDEEQTGASIRSRLAALQETTRELIVAQHSESVAEITVSAAKSVLDMPATSLWTYEEADDCLRPSAMTAAVRGAYDGDPPPIGPDDEVLWELYEHDEFRVFEDLDYRIEATDTVVQSAIVAPLGRRGLLITATDSGGFGETETELFRLLAGAAGSALSRTARERELQRQNERLDQFTSVVSHDLQTPIQLAVTQLELYRETGDEVHLDKLADAHERMTALVDDLLALARQGDTVDTLQPVSLATVAEDAWQGIDAGAARLRVADDATVEADPGRLDQLLSNLFANAVEHSSTNSASQARQNAVEHSSTSPASDGQRDAAEQSSTSPDSQARREAVEDGSTKAASAVETEGADAGVTVTAGPLADAQGFYVGDDGPGIPEDERERVFERGYTTSDAGTGFGLSIVAEIADAHGWAVEVTDSEAGGTRFEIRTA